MEGDRMMIKWCCANMRNAITVNTFVIKFGDIRLDGIKLNYCPFCGKYINTLEDEQ